MQLGDQERDDDVVNRTAEWVASGELECEDAARYVHELLESTDAHGVASTHDGVVVVLCVHTTIQHGMAVHGSMEDCEEAVVEKQAAHNLREARECGGCVGWKNAPRLDVVVHRQRCQVEKYLLRDVSLRFPLVHAFGSLQSVPRGNVRVSDEVNGVPQSHPKGERRGS